MTNLKHKKLRMFWLCERKSLSHVHKMPVNKKRPHCPDQRALKGEGVTWEGAVNKNSYWCNIVMELADLFLMYIIMRW